VGPPEGHTHDRENQAAERRKPRPRRCLLKGCEQRFPHRHYGWRPSLHWV